VIGQWGRDWIGADPMRLANEPSGFTYQTVLPSIIVPYGGVNDLLAIARQFGVRSLVLDANRSEQLTALYARSNLERRLILRETFGLVQLYEISSP
jgi:hypothetical protein